MQILTTLQLISAELIRSLCWTLIHSLWQGLIAAVIAGVIVFYTKHARSRLRYNLLSALFILILLGAGLTFYMEYNLFIPQDMPSDQAMLLRLESSDHNYQSTTIITEESSFDITGIINFLNRNASFVVLLWFIFFLAKCINVIMGIYKVNRIRTLYIHQPSVTWINKLEELKNKLGITKKVLLFESMLVKTPVTVGYLKALILVPIGLLANLPADQVESILLHELAHIRRKDYIVNFLQSLAEAVLFFNPAVLWISTLIREERENCCDDIVVANMPDKRNYLDALVSFHEYTMNKSYAIGFAGQRNYILDRVKRLVYNENKKLNIIERTILVLGVIILSACGFIIKTKAEKEVYKIPQSTLIMPQDTKLLNNETFISANETDTFPDKKRTTIKSSVSNNVFISLRFDKTNDPRDPIHTYEIIDNNATTFRVTRTNNQMIALSVNGQSIPANQLSNYQNIFIKAEDFIQERYKKKALMLGHRLDDKKNSESVRNISPKKEKLMPGSKLVVKDGKTKPGVDKLSNQSVSENIKIKKETAENADWQKDAQRIKDVIQELVQAGVVENAASVDWFAINESKMMVNDKEINQALHEKLKSKYGIKTNYGLFYGLTKMSGSGIYYDKKDLQSFIGKE